MTNYPLIEKMVTEKPQNQVIMDFLMWLRNEKNYYIAEHLDHEYSDLVKVPESDVVLMAEYLDIDLDAYEKEVDAFKKAIDTVTTIKDRG
jgi:hypothetical protein